MPVTRFDTVSCDPRLGSPDLRYRPGGRVTRAGLLGLLGLLALAWSAGAVVLAWERSSSAGILGYWLYYGLASGVYDTALDVGDVGTASVGGLTPGQTYYFAVTAYDADGAQSPYSNEVSALVLLPEDTQPPTVRLLGPVDGSVVPRGGIVELVAEAADDVGVTLVQLLVQGAVHCTVPQPSYRCPWEVPNAGKKTYTLAAHASDAAGHTGVSAVVTVSTE
ncbi:MAG TPA: Ig-like domain-containing protein [Candidatus Tectomicrobia bacterium]|nr:Ig-like domain-containing protein [Candidatus Tectomicrobia bacterium]